MLDEVMLANLIQVVLDKSLVMWISNWIELINNECHDFKIPEWDARNIEKKGASWYIPSPFGAESVQLWPRSQGGGQVQGTQWLFYELVLLPDLRIYLYE